MTSPVHEACPLKSYIGNGDEGELQDRLSELPDEILLSIMSSLTMKEATKTSLLSHKWKNLLAYLPQVIFEDPRTMERMAAIPVHDELAGQERSTFIMRVNNALQRHLGLAIDVFKVTFDLDISCQPHINWVVFALEKQVRTLELDFRRSSGFTRGGSTHNLYHLRPEYCMPLELHHRVTGNRPALRSLRLYDVNVSGEVIERFLQLCPLLEILFVVGSVYLTKICISGSSVALKHLTVSRCPNIKTIDISAPKLVSFTFFGHPVELHIRNGTSLVEVAVGGYPAHRIAYTMEYISKYFAQLEYLRLLPNLDKQYNLGFDVHGFPDLINLKHLELAPVGFDDHTLKGWIPFLETCPLLQKLTLRIRCLAPPVRPPFRAIKRYGRPHKCLRTLDIVGFRGCRFDLELATYVIDNAVMLEEVIINLSRFLDPKQIKDAQKCAAEFGRNLPGGAKFVYETKPEFDTRDYL